MPSVEAVVTGAGGFIGGHLIRAMLTKGQSVRAVDPLIEKEFGWKPSMRRRDGLEITRRWVHDEVTAKLGKR